MNNLVYFRGILVGPMIVTVSWAVEINLVYFAQKRWLICDCDLRIFRLKICARDAIPGKLE